LMYLMNRGGGQANRLAQARPGQAGVIGHHGSPYQFSPETRIKLADGTESYVGGRNALQEIPQSAEVIEDLPYGRFRNDAIDSGEGAQAYGYGDAYIAENKDVAIGYRDKLAGPAIKSVTADLYTIAGDDGWMIKGYDEAGEFVPVINQYLTSDEIAKYYGEELRRKVIDSKHGGKFKNLNIQDGALYDVDVPDESIANMLDWDAPMSEQTEAVKTFAEDILGDRYSGEWTGGEFYAEAGDPEDISRQMNVLGIPGIKYFDGDSRAAMEGTRNFVVFDGKLAKILKRE